MTAVLIGSGTYARRWVRYEIAKSVERRNKIVGIHINSVAGKDGLTKRSGLNPLDHMGLAISDDGLTGRLNESSGTEWVWYSDLEGFALRPQPTDMRGKSYYLNHWFKTFDWIADAGYRNFNQWID